MHLCKRAIHFIPKAFVDEDGGLTPKGIFYLLMIVGLLTSVVFFFLTDGESFFSILYRERSDYFMDYFNSIYYSENGPYSEFKVMYPGLITVFYSAIGKLLAITGTDTSLDGFAIRSSLFGMISYILVTLFSLLLLMCVLYFRKRISKREFVLFLTLILTSYPMLYCIDRGNSMLIAVIFSLLFFIFFNSDVKREKYLSYVFLGIAIAVKIYPAFFGILVIKEALEKKDAKGLVSCMFICIMLFIVPFFLTDGTATDMIHTALSYSQAVDITEHVNLIRIIVTTSEILNIQLIGLRESGILLSLIMYGIIAIMLLADRTIPYWEAISILVCAQILFAGLGTAYLLLYMIVPAWYFVNSSIPKGKREYAISILFVIILALVPGILRLQADHLTFIKALSVLALMVILIFSSALRIKSQIKIGS